MRSAALLLCACLAACSGAETGPSPLALNKPIPETSIALGGFHTCVLSATGAAYCWGRNNAGQLGDATLVAHSAPAAVTMPTGVTFVQISAAGSATCAVTSTRQLYCWGVIPASTTPLSVPTVMPVNTPVQSVSVGTFGVCMLDTAGRAYCLGFNSSGQLGTGDSTTSTLPRAVKSGLNFKSISAGLNSACALTSAGEAWCWGNNAQRTLGQSAVPSNSPVPVAVQGGLVFTSLSLGATLACGIVQGGNTFCWGQSYYGSGGFGFATEISQAPPVSFIAPTGLAGSLAFKSVTPGTGNDTFDATCGLTTDGTAYCWGINASGALGTSGGLPGSCATTTTFGAYPCTNVPTPVGTSLKFLSLASGAEVTCGITVSHTLLCWGFNSFGQVGDGTSTNQFAPVLISTPSPLP